MKVINKIIKYEHLLLYLFLLFQLINFSNTASCTWNGSNGNSWNTNNKWSTCKGTNNDPPDASTGIFFFKFL
jgi:hypothetical protein